MTESANVLAANLPANIKFLASQIARKPVVFTPEWGSTVEEAFSLYTRTSTVNLLLAVNDLLAEFNWPFPAYFSLRGKFGGNVLDALKLRIWLVRATAQIFRSLFEFLPAPDGLSHKKARDLIDASMVRFFRLHSRAVFKYWDQHPLLASKRAVLADVGCCFREKLWAACIPTTLPLLDHVMRAFFHTDKLHVSVQTLWTAFEKAEILPKHLKPGCAVDKDSVTHATGRALIARIEEDLRLPGVLLSSFVEFAGTYYGWFTVDAGGHPSTLNRHAVMHCASEYWSEINATKLFTFFDLTLRLEKPLRTLIHGPAAVG